MSRKYILGIDQSTQGTKSLLFDEEGELIARCDLAHKQMVNELGWVEHDPIEIINNTYQVVRDIIKKSGIDKNHIIGVGISNQRETAVVWKRGSVTPLCPAIVWQCARGEEICKEIEKANQGDMIKSRTGLPLSPYFSAAKISWILKHIEGAKELSDSNLLCCGTMDSWLVYNLTKDHCFKTDYSNASRTQLYNITDLKWDEDVCNSFGINKETLAQVCDSNSCFGYTDFNGILPKEIPIHSVLGDSHGALFGQGCLGSGMIKATYGTGSSVMMNIGNKPVLSKKGIVTSLAWGMDGSVEYVLEGNINYTGAVISWLQHDLKLISSASETEILAKQANPADKTYLVPAFTGLGAPYWDSKATGVLTGITRTTRQAEVVRAGLDCIAYQITDIIRLMSEESGMQIEELRVDGGPTKNTYLMQFQSDMLGINVKVPEAEELSGIGAAFAAGIALGLYDKNSIFTHIIRTKYETAMEEDRQKILYNGWKQAVGSVLTKKPD